MHVYFCVCVSACLNVCVCTGLHACVYVLSYCLAVLCRLRPVVSGNIRALDSPVVLDGYKIPKGVSCMLNVLTVYSIVQYASKSVHCK